MRCKYGEAAVRGVHAAALTGVQLTGMAAQLVQSRAATRVR